MAASHAAEAAKRQRAGRLPPPGGKVGMAASHAAEAVGVSRRAVEKAKRVRKQAPELEQKVLSGELTLSAAENQIRDKVLALPKKTNRKGEIEVAPTAAELAKVDAAFTKALDESWLFPWRETIRHLRTAKEYYLDSPGQYLSQRTQLTPKQYKRYMAEVDEATSILSQLKKEVTQWQEAV